MFGSINYYLAGGGAAAPVCFGCATYGTAGSFTFTVPSGVSKISVVCVSGGGGGTSGCDNIQNGGGGYGGGLSYTNCISVTAGESLAVVVGAGGAGPSITCSLRPGGFSSLSRGATVLIKALNQCNTASGVGAVKYNGGIGGPRECQGRGTLTGSGAAGYAGNGGNSQAYMSYSSGVGQAGSGGSAGSGGKYNQLGGAGGGVGLIVQGSSGAAGGASQFTTGGGGGSGGTNGGASNLTAGVYGGTTGGVFCSGGGCNNIPPGAKGGIRIIYGGTGKSYPSNSAP